ncbi:MAG: cobinamide kinase, partial [Lachnospiraceae bacterium]|nr:cobinamide kinase [Lachnospiraceae bacterium]
EAVIVVNELGSGVVPIDAFDRNYRETTGRICCELAKKAREVHRVVCGIGMVIKHD